MGLGNFARIAATLGLAFAAVAPAQAGDDTIEVAFDTALGTELRAPRDYTPDYDTPFERQIAQLADGSNGRIGVAAIDLATGEQLAVLGDQRFPMASTSKIAVAAAFLEGVDQGRFSLTSEYPLLLPVNSQPFSSPVAPVRKGKYLQARELIHLMLTRSSNSATDALLAAVGGPNVVNDWVNRAGITEYNLTRDIATLVRDDGEIDPAVQIDTRDSATPKAMVQLLRGLYQGRWLSPESRDFLIRTMEECRTGTRRIPANLPGDVTVAHKTGSLNNTSSDVGILTAPDGRTIALAIYVTGQGSRLNREHKIASIARAIYDGYTSKDSRQWVSASYSSAH
ncbi:beta-lactamase class A [Altererythrobacter atlanticus]|uniref:Beta-lactamase n=1 Tax=Croceibacterium atlanticum TaxID=1267766 RepID=A0A0F7KWQ3_9SPHN|nr:class A beta-lactamase [Croceibacterium atlanticum]AKH43652.1 Extended-spectrum beta-lactamase PER-1 precursor [Croceibacterium atlanticum]MBB5733864.1 beta-lactamase class A [Croceibacterium atlanticum]